MPAISSALRPSRAWLALVLVTVSAVAATTQPAPARDEFATRARQLASSAGAEVGIALRTLDGTTSAWVEADRTFHAASTMKVPVMLELFSQRDAGRLSLDDTLVIRETFSSIVDGSPYALAAADDSETSLYGALGTPRSLRSLCEAMIVVSSNLATNLLIEKVGVEAVRATVARLGAAGVEVRRGVEDTRAFQAGRNNTTTARGLLVLLEALATGRAAGPESTREMIDILARQQFDEGIPAGVPAGTRVAHKTGQITRIHHDAGIVYAPRPYVLVVLVRGLDDEKASAALIADVSRAAYAATQR